MIRAWSAMICAAAGSQGAEQGRVGGVEPAGTVAESVFSNRGRAHGRGLSDGALTDGQSRQARENDGEFQASGHRNAPIPVSSARKRARERASGEALRTPWARFDSALLSAWTLQAAGTKGALPSTAGLQTLEGAGQTIQAAARGGGR